MFSVTDLITLARLIYPYNLDLAIGLRVRLLAILKTYIINYSRRRKKKDFGVLTGFIYADVIKLERG
jgi:hypothetical protein